MNKRIDRSAKPATLSNKISIEEGVDEQNELQNLSQNESDMSITQWENASSSPNQLRKSQKEDDSTGSKIRKQLGDDQDDNDLKLVHSLSVRENINEVIPGIQAIIGKAQERKKQREEVQQQIEDIFNESVVQKEMSKQNEIDEEVEVSLKKTEEQVAPENIVIPLIGNLTPQEMKLLQHDNVLGILKEIKELVDEDGNVTEFVYVKIVPKNSKCAENIFGKSKQ